MRFLRLLMLGLLLNGTAQAARLEVDLSGVSGETEDNVRAIVGLFELAKQEEVDPFTLRFYLERADAEVATALAPFGYYQPTVETRLESEASPWVAHLRIERGQPVRVTSIAMHFLQDNQPAALNFMLPPFPLKPGDRLDHREYEAGKRAIRNALFDNGYIDSAPSFSEVRVDPAAREAFITLIWQIGEQHRFGEVLFEGSQFPDDFMGRFIPFERGDVYSQDQILELSARLRDSAYFDRVDIEPDLQAEGHEVPLVVRLEPNEKTLYELGATYGTDSGLGVEADIERRWLSRRGDKAALSLNYSQRRQTAGLRYDIPSKRRFNAFYQLGVSFTEEQTDAADSRAYRIGISRFRPWGSWRRTDAINYLIERSEFGDSVTRSDFLLPAITLSRAEGDEDPIPASGYTLRGTLRGAAEPLLSDTSLVQLNLFVKWIMNLGERSRLLLRGELGATVTQDFDEHPASLRFFAGGDRSIRGYDYESLGPTDADGNIIGGKHLIVGSAEYEYIVRGPWRAAVFLDAGNAFNDFGDDLELGAGFGVRYASPVGLIRADIGFPVSSDDQGVRLHLVVGPDL